VSIQKSANGLKKNKREKPWQSSAPPLAELHFAVHVANVSHGGAGRMSGLRFEPETLCFTSKSSVGNASGYLEIGGIVFFIFTSKCASVATCKHPPAHKLHSAFWPMVFNPAKPVFWGREKGEELIHSHLISYYHHSLDLP